MHVFLISKKPFKNLAAAGIEVKANKLLAFVSPSLHKSGEFGGVQYGTEMVQKTRSL
jgi:hypothetical protein